MDLIAERINRQLKDQYGIDTITGREMWRVVWSENQFENRYDTYEDFDSSGSLIRRVTENRYVKKYETNQGAPWISNRYILERLVLIPVQDERTLPTNKQSYEPIWVFETQTGEALPPKYEVCKIVADTILSVQKTGQLPRYFDPRKGKVNGEFEKEKLDRTIEAMFGGEEEQTKLPGETISVPSNYKVN